MRRKYLLGAALALGLTATAAAQQTPPATPPTTPTTGGTSPQGPTPPPGTPTTGGTAPGTAPKAPPGTPTTGGTAPPGTPTTGGTRPGATPTAPPGTPTTGGTAPGTAPRVPPGTPTTGGTAPPGTPTTGGPTTAPGSPGAGVTPGAGTTTGTTASASPFPTALYQQSDVALSLGLTDRQSADLNRLNTTLQTRYASDFQGISRLPAADQVARRAELERQYRQDFLTGARDIFNANQLNRYQQLDYQYGGFRALSDPVVQRQLGLTEAQIRDLQASIDWSTGQMREITTTAATDRERAARLYTDYQRAFTDRFNRFLTPEQQRTWGTLVGDPYTFRSPFTAGTSTAAPGTNATGVNPGAGPGGTTGTAPGTTGGPTPGGTGTLPPGAGSPPKR